MGTVNWPVAIERNRDALVRIVAVLLALAGLEEDAILGSSPDLTRGPGMTRQLRSYVIRILRPAESALRRLIIIAARGMVVTVSRRASSAKHTPAKRVPATGIVHPPGYDPEPPSARPAASAVPAFSLLDPLKRFDVRRRRYGKSVPRVRCLSDDWSVPVYLRVPEPPAKPVPAPDEPVDAARLRRRLISLKRALDDLDGQAKRFARWRARRDLAVERANSEPAPAAKPLGTKHRYPRFYPLRPGWPPGRRKRPIHEVDEILKDCHSLALYTMKWPNST